MDKGDDNSKLTLKPRVPVASLCAADAVGCLFVAIAAFGFSRSWPFTLAFTSALAAILALVVSALYFLGRKRVFYFYTSRFSIWRDEKCRFKIDYDKILKVRWYKEGIVLEYGSNELKRISLTLGREQTKELYRFWKLWRPQLTEGITDLSRNALGIEE